jgi:formate dehydrogenase major subunit/NADH-quinone oxidoreductase subunit G
MVNLTINGKPIKAPTGTSILRAAINNGIYIPSLCYIREADPALSACRLCMVEIEGRAALAAACSEPIGEGLKVMTDTPRVTRACRAAFDLIMSNHRVECAKCPKDGNCGLQETAQFLKRPLKQKRYRALIPDFAVDDSHPRLLFDRNKCITCGKCVWTCRTKGHGALDFAGRGLATHVSLFGGQSFQHLDCTDCEAACAGACPTGALTLKNAKATHRKAPAHA